jgi:glycosyltransferase involved in cell wall biosynthesis
MSPRFTVIIATYNWSTVLPYSIGSVLGQTFHDFELLVIGDGCTDDSEQVVRAIEDERVSWINIARAGHQSGPNNEGLRRARGEYVAYLGHDDLWLPHHLQVLGAALDAGADVAHAAAAVIMEDGTAHHASTLFPTSSAHRRSITEVTGGWGDFRRLTILPEEDFWNRAHAAGMRFAFVPRLTAIKFPAAYRRNVYRDQPSHEQAAWTERIRSEPGLEMNLLTNMAMRLDRPLSIPERIARVILQPWRFPGIVWRRITRQQGAAVRRMKRFKGVRD